MSLLICSCASVVDEISDDFGDGFITDGFDTGGSGSERNTTGAVSATGGALTGGTSNNGTLTGGVSSGGAFTGGNGGLATGGDNTGGGAISSTGANGILNLSVTDFAGNHAPNPDTVEEDKKYINGDAILYRSAKPTASANEHHANQLHSRVTYVFQVENSCFEKLEFCH